MITFIDTLFPLLAIIIVFGTPKGCHKTINILLAGMLVFVYGLEEYALDPDTHLFDGAWYDATLTILYAGMACVFYRVGGRIQFYLTSAGTVLHLGYWMSWGLGVFPVNLFYSEVFVTLTIMQLLAASKGMLWSVLYKRTQGVKNGLLRHNSHGFISRIIRRGDS